MEESCPTISAVVLNWESYKDTASCVRSLQELDNDNIEIIVVDNGSSDDSMEILSEKFGKSIEMVCNESNLGFSGGMNAGIRIALKNDTNYVWLLNNDVIIPDDFKIQTIYKYLDQNPSVGILSPRILSDDEQKSCWFEKGFVDERSGIATHNDMQRAVFTFRQPENIDQSKKSIPSEYVPFASAFIRSEIFKNVGLLPEETFIYYEDVIYCEKVSEAGYTVQTLLNSDVLHGVNSSGSSKLAKYYQARNRIRYNITSKQISYEFILLNIWWSILVIGKHVVYTPTIIFAVVAGIIDGLRSKKGKKRYPK